MGDLKSADSCVHLLILTKGLALGAAAGLVTDRPIGWLVSGLITVTGLPVSIACNITATTNVDDVTVPLGAPAQPSAIPPGSNL